MKPALSSLLILTPVLLMGCSHESQPVQAATPTTQAQLVQATQQQLPQPIRTSGTVHAKETAMISAQMPGTIRQVLVQAGDRVRAGQLLIALDDSATRSEVNRAVAGQLAVEKQQMAAQAGATLASGTLARYQELKDEKSVMQLRAPCAGVVTARTADPGTLATPGTPLLQVDRDGPLQLYTAVDESRIGSVRMGMKLPVTVDGVGDLTATVAQIVPAADPSSRSFLVKLDLPASKQLRAGMYATANFPGDVRAVILAPESAVVMRGSLACVYALDAEGVAQLRYVTLGNRHGNDVEILSGVAAGETLVNHPGDRDLAGKRIEAQP
jgi:multidrug efflux pump subunit AcrA (membrane-fusion protein)